MALALMAVFAGVLTVLAPCILPILPIILTGSLGERDWYRSLIIAFSLSISVIIFTLLLKTSTLFLEISPTVWKLISALIIFVFALTLLFPQEWWKIEKKVDLQSTSQLLLHRASKHSGLWGNILIGAALGPVFTSCSPTYFLILGQVFPVNFSWGMVLMIFYGLGLFIIVFLLGIFGQRLVYILRWAVRPAGWFRRLLGVVLVFLAVAIITGFDKVIEAWILQTQFFEHITRFEMSLLSDID